MGDTGRPGRARSKFSVRRERLEGAYLRTRPDITFIVGPGGYGKTVLAAQLVAASLDTALWISLGGQTPSTADLPSAVALAIPANREGERHATVADAVMADGGWERLELALAAAPAASLVILDGFGVFSSTQFAYDFLALCRRILRDDAQVLITARKLDDWHATGTSDITVWTIGRDLLEFGHDQVAALSAHVLQRELKSEELDRLLESSAGQPALLTLLLRNVAVSGLTIHDVLARAPRDVAGHVAALVDGSVPDEVLTVLRVAAMLKHGTVRQLAEIANADLRAVGQAEQLLPLLRLTGAKGSVRRFEMHDIACEVFGAGSAGGVCLPREVLAAAHELALRGEYARLFEILERADDSRLYLEWAERLGPAMIEDARLDLLESVLDQVPAVVQSGSPRLLLLAALVQRSKGCTSEAFTLAAAARRAADMSGEAAATAECLMVEIRLHWDVADYVGILPRMQRAFASACARGDSDTQAMLCGYLASAYAQLGDVEKGRDYALLYSKVSHMPGVRPGTRAQALQPVLFVLGFLVGDIARAAQMLREAKAESKYPQALALQCDANLASLLVEMGRVGSVLNVVTSVRDQLSACGFSILGDACSGTEGMVRAALGEFGAAERLMRAAVEDAVCQDDRFSIEYNRLYRSVIRRGCGMLDEALVDSEDALAALSEIGGALPVMRCLATIEVAANLLALGDLPRAHSLAAESAAEAATWAAAYHLLRADMVLAEIERQEGDVDAAIARMALHRDYIVTESANWQIAMYIRAFPGLLGVLTSAIGVEALPSHMLRMVLPEYARPALDSCGGMIPKVDLERLATRLLGKRAAAVYMRDRSLGPKATVRLFGGMEVVTPSGPVTDKDWRKRKARLLFALLVLRRGQDMPREQVFDHFWPEMDESRAKSNFYVTWSIMKRALGSGGKDNEPSPYVEHVGGVCRIVPSAISSDYAEFEDALAAMRKADRAGDAGLALASAERVAEQYRGELLPGELYDDWLSPIRDRCRQDYGDAMLRAAQLCHSAGDTEKALHLVRAGLGQDPWREDLYQGALRYLIHSGQRSGAIETYVACKSKLAEDLGLDPSSETQRLYDQILAMEDPPSAPAKG